MHGYKDLRNIKHDLLDKQCHIIVVKFFLLQYDLFRKSKQKIKLNSGKIKTEILSYKNKILRSQEISEKFLFIYNENTIKDTKDKGGLVLKERRTKI